MSSLKLIGRIWQKSKHLTFGECAVGIITRPSSLKLKLNRNLSVGGTFLITQKMMPLDDTKAGFYQVTLWYIRCSYVLDLDLYRV